MDRGGGQPLYYGVLGVCTGASDEEIRRAYRNLAMQWHPDKLARTPSLLGEAKQKFQQIQEAYSVLSDRRKRMLYDAQGCIALKSMRMRPRDLLILWMKWCLS